MTTTHDVPPGGCPVCFYKIDKASHAYEDDGRAPIAGDFTICINCAAVLVFGDDLIPRVPELPDFKDVPTEQLLQLWRAKDTMERFIVEHPRSEPPCAT